MKTELERELEGLKINEQINEYSVSLGYGTAEYTIDLNSNNSLDLKILAKRLSNKYGACDFALYNSGSGRAVKFVVFL